jgi:hypothetical protein
MGYHSGRTSTGESTKKNADDDAVFQELLVRFSGTVGVCLAWTGTDLLLGMEKQVTIDIVPVLLYNDALLRLELLLQSSRRGSGGSILR